MLKISNVSKTFAPGTVNEKKALSNINLDLKKGDFGTGRVLVFPSRAELGELMDKLCGILDRGDDVAMVVLGDIGVYSTYMYIDEAVRGRGYETSIIAGIP